jgi:hypothetical protein
MRKAKWKPSTAEIIGAIAGILLALTALAFSILTLTYSQALYEWGVAGKIAGPVLGLIALGIMWLLLTGRYRKDAPDDDNPTENPPN